MKEKIKGFIPTKRRLIQLYAALLYNAHLKGFISGNIFTGMSKVLCVPGFNCYSCPGAIGACPLGALQNALASSGNRAPTYVLGILMLYGLILGRTICGFICPLGLLQELVHKLPTPKIRKNRITHILSYLKYVILAIFVVAIPLWYAVQHLPVPAFCKYICPAGTFEGAIGLLSNPVNADKFSMLGILFTRKFIILIVLIILCIFIYRAFCRFLCPLGAIYGFFARVNLVGVKVEKSKCIDCGKCVSHCGMDILRVGDHECINCGECIDVCPTKAISFKAGKIVLRENEAALSPEKRSKTRRIEISAWAAALLILFGALYYANRSDKAAVPETPETAAAVEVQGEESSAEAPAEAETQESLPVGKEIGMLAPDFTVPVYGSEDSFTLSEHRGKIVVINFWAVWCTPCCAELPHFDAVAEEYAEDVEVIAVHSSLITDDVEGYLANYDYSMPFALDESGDVIASFGGSTMLPHSIVVDEDGVIVYNSTGSLTYEKLVSLLPLE